MSANAYLVARICTPVERRQDHCVDADGIAPIGRIAQRVGHDDPALLRVKQGQSADSSDLPRERQLMPVNVSNWGKHQRPSFLNAAQLGASSA